MAEISLAHMVSTDHAAEFAGDKTQGTLIVNGKECSVTVMTDTESVTEAALAFLEDINEQNDVDQAELLKHEFVEITEEIIFIEEEIQTLSTLLESTGAQDESTALETPHQPNGEKALNRDSRAQNQTRKQAEGGPSSQGRTEIYSSLFSLARSFNMTLSENRPKKESEMAKREETLQGRKEGFERPAAFIADRPSFERPSDPFFDRDREGQKEREKDQEEENEGFAGNQEQKDQSKDREEKSKKIVSIKNIQGARNDRKTNSNNLRASHPQDPQSPQSPAKAPASMENIFIRFMALMARILGQAELEAHQLYVRIKERTDAIDLLTNLIAKINNEKGAIDWSNNEEMKKLVDRARALGVEIPDGKYKWSEEEKKLLKENIQTRKDSMEKVTQLERTDMQRYLQEASQCHQARSNVLKLLKEVVDTFVHNIRPS
jgi:hypothetical protein